MLTDTERKQARTLDAGDPAAPTALPQPLEFWRGALGGPHRELAELALARISCPLCGQKLSVCAASADAGDVSCGSVSSTATREPRAGGSS